MAFQDDPGIAFKETTIQGKHEDREWFYNPQLQRILRHYPEKQLSKRYHEYRHRSKTWPKSRSLMEMALRVVVNNLHTTTEDTLANIPLPYLWLILDECAINNMLSFHAWKMLSNLLRADQDPDPDKKHQHVDSVFSYSVQIDSPSYDLSYYTRHLTCPRTSIDFLTRLCIRDCCFRSDELLALARLNNLLLLEIDDDDEGTQAAASVTDHLIKGWSETQTCFPSLQHLTLESQSISVRSLGYVLKFPSLYVYEVCKPRYQSWTELRRRGKDIARQRGWILIDPDDNRSAIDLVQSPPSVDGIPVAEIDLRGAPLTYKPPRRRMVGFYRGASSNSPRATSPPMEPSPSRPDEPTSRTNIQARKKRKLRDVLSSFEV